MFYMVINTYFCKKNNMSIKSLLFKGAFALSACFTIATSKAQTLPPAPDHIIIVIMENYSYSDIIGSSAAPYINSLLTDTNACIFTQSYAIEHPSQPNYFDFYSGSNQGVTDDYVPAAAPFSTDNLGSQLISASKSFVTYSEDLPSAGFTGASSGLYVAKHNPAVYWIGGAAHSVPSTVDQPFTSFPIAANYATLPTVSYVIPNEVNDMHNGSISAGDTWLNTHLDTLKQWTLAHNSLYIITWDEDDFLGTNNIPTIFYGPMVKHGSYSNHIDHFNVLRTIENFYGLAYAGAAATSTTITNCWKYPSSSISNVNVTTGTFTVYPNPASDVVTFAAAQAVTEPMELTITDVVGKVLGSYSITSADLNINTAAFPAGVCYYRISGSNNFSEVGKLVIAH
jgi:phosphatidylinositol-3-phosphatase